MAERGAPVGNKNATRDRRMVTDALRRAAAQNPNKLAEACMAVLDNAANGDLAAFTVLADRLDGKPQQTNVLEGSDDKPITAKIITEYVNATKAG